MTQHAAVLDEGWQPGSRLPRVVNDDDELSARHLLAAVALHVVVLGGALLLPGVDPPADDIVTVDLIMQEQGASGSAGGSETAAEALASAAQPAQAPQPKPTVKPRPQRVAQPAVQPTPKPRPRPAKVPPKPAPTVAPAPVETPAAAPQPVPTPAVPPPPADARSGITATVGTLVEAGGASRGSDGSGAGGAKGSGHGAAGSGAGVFGEGDGPGDEYFERLRRWLAKHKHYPEAALKQKQQGTVTVEFVLARDGTVLDAAIEKSSGHPLIDRATLDMMRRASPVPPLPDRFKGERIKIAMPIDYKIGFFGRLF